MYILRELLDKFEERYPFLLDSGIHYIKLLDRDSIVLTIGRGDSYLFDDSRPANKLIRIKFIDEDEELDDHDWRLGFSYWLRKEMENNDMNEDELAEETGIPRSTITRYINGTAKPSMETLSDIAIALTCYEEDLIPHDFVPVR